MWWWQPEIGAAARVGDEMEKRMGEIGERER